MKAKKLQRVLNSPLGSALGVVAVLVALFGWLRSDIGGLRTPVASLQTAVSSLNTTVRALDETVVSLGERIARVEGEQAAYRLLIPGMPATGDGDVPAFLDLAAGDAQRGLSTGAFPADFTPDAGVFEAFGR